MRKYFYFGQTIKDRSVIGYSNGVAELDFTGPDMMEPVTRLEQAVAQRRNLAPDERFLVTCLSPVD